MTSASKTVLLKDFIHVWCLFFPTLKKLPLIGGMSKEKHRLINEIELFAQLAEGNEGAFVEIYWHFTKRLYPFVKKMVHDEQVSEEIIQDVFVQIWEKRVMFAGIQYPTSYLFNITSNRTLNYLKREKNHARILETYARTNSELSNETEDFVSLKERNEIISEAIAGLPEQRRIIFELSRTDGLTNEQIAERLNLSRQTVKNQLVHALKHIRAFMERREGFFSFALYFLLTRNK